MSHQKNSIPTTTVPLPYLTHSHEITYKIYFINLIPYQKQTITMREMGGLC